MAEQVSFEKKARLSTDGGTNWLDIPATSAGLERLAEVLETTKMGLTQETAFRTRVTGLKDWSVSIEGNWEDDSDALEAVTTAWLNGTNLMIQYLPTGQEDSKGLQGTVVVESNPQSGDVAGLETYSISFQGNGPVTATA